MLSILYDEQASLESSVNAFAKTKVEPVPIFTNEDRFVLASAMQKAIRRGKFEIALSAGLSLLIVDPIKCWSRLKIISIEDIGIANLPLAAKVHWAADHKKWRMDTFGDDVILAYLLNELCISANSRFSNDLLCIANMHAGYKEKAVEINRLNDHELAELYLNKKSRIMERVMAGWYLSGVSIRSEKNMVLRKGNVRNFLALHSMSEYPDDLLTVMRRSFSGGGGYGRTLALAWEHRNQAPEIKLRNECDSSSPTIGAWPSETYDVHTRLGKKAYETILQANNPIADFLKKKVTHQKQVPAFGMTVFALEGMQLKAREEYFGVPDLLELAVRSYVSQHSLTGAAREDFFQIVGENFYLIHEARSNALNRQRGKQP